MDQDIKASSANSDDPFGARFTEAIRANQAATDVFDETLADFLGINRTDGRCLDIIDRRGKLTAGELAAESGLTTGAVTAVIDRLESAGYVRRIRDMLDRRKIWIEMTDAMHAITARIFGHYSRTGQTLMARFSPDQIRAIIEFLEMGVLLNTELAAVLRANLDPQATTAEARLIQARAFERAVEANQARLDAELRKIGAE